MATPDLSLDNPIARAERDHLVRKLHRGSRWRRRLFMVGGVIVLGLMLANRLDDMGVFIMLSGGMEIYLLLFMTAILGIVHFGLMFRTLSMSAETFVREKRGGTWESLVLTSAGARRLVLGKLWGVIHIVWRDYVVLAIFRASLTVVLGVVLAGEHGASLFEMQAEPVSSAVIGAVLAWFLIFALTMMNMIFTVSAGVAGSLFGRVTTPGLSTGQTARMVALVTPMVLLLAPVIVLIPLQNEQFTYHGLLLIGGVQLSLIDNGMIFMASLANPYDAQGLIYVMVGVLSLLTYVALTLILLWIAKRVAIRQGAAHQ